MPCKIKYISEEDVSSIIMNRRADNTIIFLSGPTSLNTPIDLLKRNDVIAVNGSARYLLENGVSPFLYVLTDVRFLLQRGEDFRHFVEKSCYTIVNRDVYEGASEDDKKYLSEHCYVIRPLYKREKGGVFKKIRLGILSLLDDNILIRVPLSKRKRLAGFSLDISRGYCSCHTIAFAALQIAYSLKYKKTVFSGLDLTGSCSRFYDEKKNPQASELSKDLNKILPFFGFFRESVPGYPVFNLSDDTAVDYEIIPFIRAEDV